MMQKFLWGSATAAYQCEGGWQEGNKGLSNWDVFCHSELNNINFETGDVSCDHYHRFEEDIKLLAESGQNAYRFSIAWTRIFPNNNHKVCHQGVDFYNNIINTCIKYNVEPLVTLYHYDIPQYLFEYGGWENRNTINYFLEYAETCFTHFGDRVQYWATINEPSYDTLCSFGYGNYPPNIQDLSIRWKVMYHMLVASAKTIILYKTMGYKGLIGLVSDSYKIETLHDNKEYQKAKDNADLFYNDFVNDICVLGEIPKLFYEQMEIDGYNIDYILPEDQIDLKLGVVDYLGINAYNRILVKPYYESNTIMTTNNKGDSKLKTRTAIANWFETDEDPNTLKNPWGMEIYPKSIYDLLIDLKGRYNNKPIIITENGVGYYDVVDDGQVHDSYLIEYCQGFIEWLLKAMQDGCDVRGYFIWSTMDLYSWINGYNKRYGLVYIDFENDNRRICKDSYYWYQKFIENWRVENE